MDIEPQKFSLATKTRGLIKHLTLFYALQMDYPLDTIYNLRLKKAA
jgi:hypothetical protein